MAGNATGEGNMTICIGNMDNMQVWIADDASNMHMLVVGKSGMGKTRALFQIEKNIAEQGGCVVIFNYHGTHESVKKTKGIQCIDAWGEGVPLTVLKSYFKEGGFADNQTDMVEHAVEVFAGTERLGIRQKAELRTAVENASKKLQAGDNELRLIQEELALLDNSSASGVVDKFSYLFRMGNLHTGDEILHSNSMVLLDLDCGSLLAQKQYAELILAALWRKIRFLQEERDFPVFVVCDECQALNLRDDGIVSEILREGRKYRFYMLAATQTLKPLKNYERSILNQAATKLYFGLADEDLNLILKHYKKKEADIITRIVRSLSVGQALAFGCFKVGNLSLQKPLKVSFLKQ